MKQDITTLVNQPPIEYLSIIENILEHLSNRVAEKVLDSISDTIEDLADKANPAKEEYYTINETCEILKISRTTLHNWNKRGVFTSDAWKGRPMYTKTHIDNFLHSKEPLL